MRTTTVLAADAIDGRFDGFEVNQPLETTVNTLRSEISRAFAVHGLIASSSNLYTAHSAIFERMALNTDPRLFGEGEPEPIDDAAPSIYVMPSSIFDERDDRIEFDENRKPIHVHNGASVIPLERAFGPDCPEVHKHVNLLNSADIVMNPLRWRFAIRDNISGINEIKALVSLGRSYGPIYHIEGTITNEPATSDGFYEAVVTLTARNVPELLTQEEELGADPLR